MEQKDCGQADASTGLMRPNKFVERFPDVCTAGALRWQLNNSASNGLDAARAVMRSGIPA